MKSLYTFLLISITIVLYSQNETSIYTDRIVIPRTTTTAISSPTEGTLIYDTTEDGFMYYDGANWNTMSSGGTGGAFERYGTVVRQVTGVNTDNFIFGREQLPMNGDSVNDKFFFFDQEKGAFRGGFTFNSLYSSPAP